MKAKLFPVATVATLALALPLAATTSASAAAQQQQTVYSCVSLAETSVLGSVAGIGCTNVGFQDGPRAIRVNGPTLSGPTSFDCDSALTPTPALIIFSGCVGR